MDDSMFDTSDGGSDFGAVAPAAKPKKAAPKAAPRKPAVPKSTTAKPKSTVPKKRAKAEIEDEDPVTEIENNFDDESLLKDTPPKAKKPKTTTTMKGGNKKPLAEVVNDNTNVDGAIAATSPKVKKKRVSEQYQKLTQLEHIIRRPDTYIGSTERSEKQMWVYNTLTDNMEFREISFVPGLFKIFDEILVNAADNKQNDKNMDMIQVVIDRQQGEISVWNNGRGIPIEIHSKEQIYIPEMIFGHLLTGSNYDDDEQKVTGGRNGYGAKLCNIFSTEFTVETADSKQKKKYKQTWTENMGKMGKAKITDNKGDDLTKVTFKPDWSKFAGMTGFDDDLEALFKRRVYDLAGTTKGVKVKLNGSLVPARNFKKYIEMYTKAIKQERGEEAASDISEIILDNPDPRWEIGFTVSDGSFQQVSFVNSIATTSGGTHVNYIADQITNKLAELVKKKNKNGPVLKLNQIRNHIFIFVNCLIVNPAFASQTKEQLTTKSSQFGSKPVVSDEFMKKIAKTEVINNIMHFAQQKADQILKKSDGSRRSRIHNPKLTDANRAGTKDGHLCTLILTEGDSAKGMAIAGRSVAGPDLFGVFPLRGKMLNVRDASVDQISKNAEIQNIKNFLGLQHKKVYTDARGLRYGHLMVMTDQDHDGSHIKGLLINFLQVQFPSLLKIPGFLVEFITPIVKVYKGDPKNPKQSRSFFTMPEYMNWKEAHKNDRGWEHKYYKGLGTSTTEESQQYFNDIDKHHKEFEVMQEQEADLIDLAFSKKKADARKEWLRQFQVGTFLDHTTKTISYTNFVNKELILFSMADNIRSIPSVIDGFKPGQRKVLFSCFKRNVKKDVKVVELAGMVSQDTHYQHGEVSLQQTIVGLAQSFVGTNNVNCLEPSGNFGTRDQGGSDAASARYIHTRLSPFARKLFNKADEPLLKSNLEDGKPIEPEMFVPILPMVLVNGADGIGTGWSTSIPNYNPEEIVENLRRKMDGEEFKPMKPWFRGFKGEVTEAGPDRFKFSGIVRQTGDAEVEISELPIRVWTQDFKEKLEDIIKAEKGPSFIKDYKDYNTHKDVSFIIQMEEKFMKASLEEGLEERFKLYKTLATSNLVAFDAEGRITKYPNVEAIMEEFYGYRLKFYQRRKEWMLQDMEKELRRFTNQARFIQMIIDGKLNISKKKKAVLIAELKKLNFDPYSKSEDAAKAGETEDVVSDDDSNDDQVPEASSYDYLLGMSLWSLTQERVEKLQRQIGDKQTEIDALLQKSNKDLWRTDLDEFVAEWRFQLEDERQRERTIRKGRRTSKKFAMAKPAYKKRKGLGDDDDDEDFEATAPKAKKAPVSKPKAQRQITQFVAPKSNALDNALAAAQRYADGTSDDNNAPVEGGEGINVKTEENEQKAKPSRAAAKKITKYAVSSDDDSDNGDDLLANLGSMVKGLPARDKPSQSTILSSLSAETTRPRAGAPPLKSASLESKTADQDNDEHGVTLGDEESVVRPVKKLNGTASNKLSKKIESSDDASLMAPPVASKPSKEVAKPQKGPGLKKAAAPRPKKTVVLSDDDEPTAELKDESFDLSDDELELKPVKKPAAKKLPAKPKPKAAAAKPAVKPQSPAAKAYAKRLVKKTIEPDDLLDSDEAEGAEPVARPARRAAATVKKASYAFDDEDDSDEHMMGDEPSAAFSDSQ